MEPHNDSVLLPFDENSFRIIFLKYPENNNNKDFFDQLEKIILRNCDDFNIASETDYTEASISIYGREKDDHPFGVHCKYTEDNAKFDFFLNLANFTIFYRCIFDNQIKAEDEIVRSILVFLKNIIENSDLKISNVEPISCFAPFYLSNLTFKNFKYCLPLINDLDKLICTCGEENVSRLLIYEKMCRYLEYGQKQYDKYFTLWSEYYIRKECLKLNIDFNDIVDDFLNRNVIVGSKVKRRIDYEYSDDCFIRGIMHENFIKNHKKIKRPSMSTIENRLKNLDYSSSLNTRIIHSLKEFQQIFINYAIETNIKYENEILPCKYIFVPNKVCFLCFKTADISKNIFDNFYFYGKKIKQSIFYPVNNEIYALMMHKFE